ncbi:ATP-binding protein [Amycolatopsis nigrescens]|uniref:ATP-binding protein n=1 Tax=Amycolatopsis nigrescens TaxID=381445 RepID=UPI00037E42A4|nr:ATP-binding protein [Amycolatopsis nigrescens]
MDQQALAVAFWFVLAALLLLLVLLLRQWRVTARLRTRSGAVEGELQARTEEDRHLVQARLPALVESLNHRPVEVPGPLREELAEVHRPVFDLVAESVQQTTSSVETSARATLKAMMRTVQNLANEQQLAISTMEERHDDPEVLADLLKIDHANSQLARRAQATAVLCGSWPGQQRSVSTLTDVVRGATSRIRDYRRVQIPAQADVAVISRAVEPVVLTVAELLDNGARHSQPSTSVEVNFGQAHNGIAIVIDDAGVGMTLEALQRAEWLLTGQGGHDINRLGDPPRIGFAVIGVLAARYGFTVSVDTRSPYGGVRAVVFLPNALLTRAVPPTETSPALTPPSPAPRPAVPAPADTPAQELERTPNGLPRRRRRQPALPNSEAGTPPPNRPVDRASTGLAAWQRGTRAGRESTPSPAAEGNTQ